jgi:hypothetical protein
MGDPALAPVARRGFAVSDGPFAAVSEPIPKI